jgi:WD40 repeat protein
VPNGLKWHADGAHIVFPLGTTIVIRNISDNSQVFLQGHTDKVTCVALSKCGRYIASGQKAEGITKVRLGAAATELSHCASQPASYNHAGTDLFVGF